MKIIPKTKQVEVNLTKRDKERTNDSSIFIHNLYPLQQIHASHQEIINIQATLLSSCNRVDIQ